MVPNGARFVTIESQVITDLDAAPRDASLAERGDQIFVMKEFGRTERIVQQPEKSW